MTTREDDDKLQYADELGVYEQLIPYLVQVSDLSGGICTTTLGIEGTKIYTRLVLGAMTIGSILPANRVNDSILWDFPSVAVLARSLMEATHRYLYLTDPDLSEEEAEFRRRLHFYRVNCEKYRLYSEKDDLELLKEFEEKLPKSKAELVASKIYRTLDNAMAKKVRSGNTDMHLTDAEVAKEHGLIGERFGFYYRLLSIHAHGSPMATTAQSNTRGRGLENEAERFYLALVMGILNRYLSKAILTQVNLLLLQEQCTKAVKFANIVQSRGEI